MPSREQAAEEASSLMMGFAERTGLASERPQQRYLWTDAFAVLNFLELAKVTGDEGYSRLALRLIDQVHRVLGRYRSDDPQTGWLSSLGEREGESHPTRGGLRIGKRLPERGPGEPFDERLEWDRDGQYFHYLTKWMQALDQASRSTGDPKFNLWARELAHAAHTGFAYGPRGPGVRRLAWKMSTDLSRTLVPSMGQHDPLDGLITAVQLERTAARLAGAEEGPGLEEAVLDFAAMTGTSDLRTADPLGLGGLLADAYRVAQLMEAGAFQDPGFLASLLAAAADGLEQYSRHEEWTEPAARRLAFRELGLALGLSALELLAREVAEDRRSVFVGADLQPLIRALAPHAALGQALVSFWLDPEHRRPPSWTEHRDINEVMLATSLVPEGFLVLSPTD